MSGQFGHTALASALESGHGAVLFAFGASGPVPFVQPGAPTSPSALDQPPEYQAQSTPFALSRSPIVGAVWAGSRRLSAVPGEYGWNGGCVVLTA